MKVASARLSDKPKSIYLTLTKGTAPMIYNANNGLKGLNGLILDPQPQIPNISREVLKDNVKSPPIAIGISTDVWVNVILPKLFLPDLNALVRLHRAGRQSLQPLLQQLWLQVRDAMIFDRSKWLRIEGVSEVSDDEPPLPPNIDERLKAVCTFFNEKDKVRPHIFERDEKIKRVWQTRILLTIPATVNGLPHNPDNFGRLMRFLKKENADNMYEEELEGDAGEGLRGEGPQRSYRILVTLDGVPGSRRLYAEDQMKLLEGKGSERRMLRPEEAITAFAILNIGPSKQGSGYFFGLDEDAANYTRTEGDVYIVGAVGPQGLSVSEYHHLNNDVGMACCEEILPVEEVPPVIDERQNEQKRHKGTE